MKKFKVFFSSLFIIGAIGVLSLFIFTDKPLENYFVFSILLGVVMMPKILFVFFVAPKKMFKHLSAAALELIFFYIIFVALYSWYFPGFDKYGLITGLIMIIFEIWGLIYYRRDEATRREFLKMMLDSIKELHGVEDIEDQFLFEGMFLLPGSEKDFVVKEKFKLSQVKYEGVPRIVHIGPNFQKHFLDMVEPGQPKRSLNQYKPLKVSEFDKVMSFVKKGDNFVYLQDIWEALVLHEKGYRLSDDNGVLAVDWQSNVFPVRKPGNETWFIEVCGNSEGWEIETYKELDSLIETENIFSKN